MRCRPVVAAMRETTQQLGQHAASEGLELEDVAVEHTETRSTITVEWRTPTEGETPQ